MTESLIQTMTTESLEKPNHVKDSLDFDFNKIELSNGPTPPDINARCLQLCKDYLSGVWSQQTVDSIVVKRVMGGVVNQLYYCAIGRPVANSHGVPQEVAIRLYGPKYDSFGDNETKTNERLNDVVTAVMASRSRLGPKIYGLFEGGEILAFYKHRPFGVKEQKDPKLRAQVFKNLAKWHAMEAPVKKFHSMSQWLDGLFDCVDRYPNFTALMDEYEMQTFKTYDLELEKGWLKQLIESTGSPLVFGHNDFRSSNIMVLEDKNNNHISDHANGDQLVVFCDFDASGYGYRGLDFGSICYEWGRTFNDYKFLHVFPEDKEIIPLIEMYITESVAIYGKTYAENPVNSVKQILKELKAFVLIYSMFRVLVNFRTDAKTEQVMKGIQVNQEMVMKFTEIQYKNYWHLKNQFIKQNVI